MKLFVFLLVIGVVYGGCSCSNSTCGNLTACADCDVATNGPGGMTCDNGVCYDDNLVANGQFFCNCTGTNFFGPNCASPNVQGGWTNWTACPTTCGAGCDCGVQTRTCTSPSPTPGCATCGCTGPAQQSCPIPAGDPCTLGKVDGYYSNWTECSVPCGNGTQTRTCIGPYGGGAPCPAAETLRKCNTWACRNCSFYYGYYTRCTKECALGGEPGWYTRQAVITTDATPGSPIQCPLQLVQNISCATSLCYTTIERMGYWYWGPVCVTEDADFNFFVARVGGNRIDAFLFDAERAWPMYLEDVNRKMPRNYGYSAVASGLDFDTVGGKAKLLAGHCYYFVVDHTYVGATNDDRFDPTTFYYSLSGGGQWGRGMSPASRATPTLSLAVLALLTFLFKC